MTVLHFRARITAPLAALALLALPRSSHALAASQRYEVRSGSAEGIGKWYLGREIAAVMGWQGAAWLEREERDREERTDLLLKALALKPGMVVADVGAGTGYLSRRMAPTVLPGGRILAIDVQPEMVRMLEQRARRDGLDNIQASLCTETDVKLDPESVDLAILVDVYHELAYPYEVLSSIVRALRPGGQVVFVEYRGEDAQVPIKALHKMTEAQVRREAQELPLEWLRTIGTLPWQHIVVFGKRR